MRQNRCTTAVHEAGHAVVSYALGFGCSRISLSTNVWKVGEYFGVGYDGFFLPNMAKTARVRRRAANGAFSRDVVAWGVITAAGAAAERAIRLHNKLPHNNHSYSGDDALITACSKELAAAHQLSSIATTYRRSVWCGAQRAICNRTILAAICALAAELNTNYWPEPSENVQGATRAMHGATARAIMRRAGIVPGMLDDLGVIQVAKAA